MHPGEQTKGDNRPGISAVLAAQADLVELEGAVLDLAAVLDGLVCGNFEIILAEVASPTTTPTPEVLAELTARCRGVPLRVQAGNYMGEAAALAAGFDAATYDLILALGTNGEIDVCQANHLLDSIEQGADLAIGYRVRRVDGLVRRLYGWGWNVLVSLLFGKTGRDVDCPFKLFRSVVWKRISVRQGDATFNAELLVRARRLGYRVVEVPVSHRRPRQGASGRAASPIEIGRALVKLGELRRGLDREEPEGPSARVAVGRRAA